MWSYGQSKLANILFAQHLSERTTNQQIFVNAVHPGAVKTDLVRQWVRWADGTPLESVVHGIFEHSYAALTGIVVWDADIAALTVLYAATSTDVVSHDLRGRFFVPIAQSATPPAHARNATLQRALWEFTEQIIARRNSQEHGPAKQ